MLVLVQVGVESCLEDCQKSQEHEAKLHKATVDQTDRCLQKMRVLQGSITQIEVSFTLHLNFPKSLHLSRLVQHSS